MSATVLVTFWRKREFDQASTDEEENLEEIVWKIKKLIEMLNWNSSLIDLRSINRTYQLSIAGFIIIL